MTRTLEALELDPGDTGTPPGQCSNPGRMRITVVFTSIAGTLAALKATARLARHLNAEIVLVVTEVVYFRYALDSPPVSPNFFATLCQALLEELHVEIPPTEIEVYLCRDSAECLKRVLAPRSLVVMGAAKRRWNMRERRLAKTLRKFDHSVLLMDSREQSEKASVQSVVRRMMTQLTAQCARKSVTPER